MSSAGKGSGSLLDGAKLYLGLGAAAVVVLFVLQNFETVSVSFLWWELRAPRAIVLLGVFGAGAVAGWSAAGLGRR